MIILTLHLLRLIHALWLVWKNALHNYLPTVFTPYKHRKTLRVVHKLIILSWGAHNLRCSSNHHIFILLCQVNSAHRRNKFFHLLYIANDNLWPSASCFFVPPGRAFWGGRDVTFFPSTWPMEQDLKQGIFIYRNTVTWESKEFQSTIMFIRNLCVYFTIIQSRTCLLALQCANNTNQLWIMFDHFCILYRI